VVYLHYCVHKCTSVYVSLTTRVCMIVSAKFVHNYVCELQKECMYEVDKE
jgi:hypothetical protein